MKPSIYLKGIDKLEQKLDQIAKVEEKGKAGLLLSQARLIRNRIRAKAPRGPTVNLKRAAYAALARDRRTAFAGIRPRRAPHGHLVEYGHGGPHPAPPHPFFRPAWDGSKAEVKRNLAEGLKKLVEGAI